MDDSFYKGQVMSNNREDNKYHIAYNGGNKEVLDKTEDFWLYISPEDNYEPEIGAVNANIADLTQKAIRSSEQDTLQL